MSSTKDNPKPLYELIQLLGDELPECPKQPKFKKYKKKMTYQQYKNQILDPWKVKSKAWDKALSKYCVGTYKEWEGDGYFISPVYKYGEDYYG